MGIILKLLRINLFREAFFGDLTLKLITAAIYQYQAKSEALLAYQFLIRRFQSFFLHLVRMRNGA